MPLKETIHGTAVCEECNVRLSGLAPIQQHLQSANHIRKVQLSQQKSADPLFCAPCSRLCNSREQLETHNDSPRHHQKVQQAFVIQQQQEALLAAHRTTFPTGHRSASRSKETNGCVDIDDCLVTESINRPAGADSPPLFSNLLGIITIAPDMSRFQNVMRMGLPASGQSQSLQNGVFFQNGKGYCKLCNIELTSPQHYQQHVSGRQHQKKLSNASGSEGIRMCNVCQVPLSGDLNVQQHFASEKHRRRVAEIEQGHNDPGSAAIQFSDSTAFALPEMTHPFDSSQKWSSHLNSNYNNNGVASSPGVLNLGHSATIQVQQTGNIAMATDQAQNVAPFPVVTLRREEPLLLNIGVKNHGLSCGYCDQNFHSGDEMVTHLMSEEHKELEKGIKSMICDICRVKLSNKESAKQHFSSDRHKGRCTLPYTNFMPARVHSSGKESAHIDDLHVTSEYRNIVQLPHDSLTSSQLSHLMSSTDELEQTFQKLRMSSDSLSSGPLQTPSKEHYNGLQGPSISLPVQSVANRETVDNTTLLLNQLNNGRRSSVPMNIVNIPPSTTEERSRDAAFAGRLIVDNHCTSQLPITTPFGHHGNQLSSKALVVDQEPNLATHVRHVNPSEQAPCQESRHQSVPEYTFNGSTGMCNVCSVAFTSKQHAESHLAGSKHQKARQRWQIPPSYMGSPFPGNTANVALGPGFNSPPDHANSTGSVNVSSTQIGYRFDGERGKCFACDIELSSPAHASQHLSGHKHHVALERWIQAKDGCTYPLFCETCNKPFTGQESAAQHFASEKHKKKASLLLGSENITTDPITGKPVVTQDGQKWYVCRTCKCLMNTDEQLEIHNLTKKHLSEEEKALKLAQQQQQFSGLESSSSPVLQQEVSNITSPLNPPTAGVHPVLAPNLEHLVTRTVDIHCTPGPLQTPARGVQGGQILVPSTSSSSPLAGGNLRNSQGTQLHFRTDGSNFRSQTLFQTNSGFGGSGSADSGGSSGNLSSDVSVDGDHNYRNKGTSNSNCLGEFSGLGLVAQRSGSRTAGRGNNPGSRSGQVLRADGNYEFDDDENIVPYPQPGETSRHNVESPVDAYASLELSSLGESSRSTMLSLTDSENKNREDRTLSGASTISDNLASMLRPESFPSAVVEASQLQPMRQYAIKGYRYFCNLCKQPMNTQEDYDKHMKGQKHQMKAANVCAPDRSKEPLTKQLVVTKQEAYNCLYKSSPRTYQVELMQKAMASDSVVIFLPTGTGKTLVSMMTISRMLKLNKTRPVLFLVDKVLLVLQQARYIINELGNHEFNRPNFTDVSRLESRKLKVAVLCGGLSTRDGTPLWQHDVIVTTAAFCQNLLMSGVLRWENMGLVIFDEAHHCTKSHPYNRLLNNHHLALDSSKRPKVLGLTASPAGRSTREETLYMLRELLANLGGAKIATVEGDIAREELDKYSSSARLVPICVPMTQSEKDFHLRLLAYFIQAYMELMRCSTLQQMTDKNLRALCDSQSVEQNEIEALACQLMNDPDDFSDMLQLANSSRRKPSADTSRYEGIRMHVLTVGMILLNAEDGIDFILDDLEREFSQTLNQRYGEFVSMGLPIKRITSYVTTLLDAARLRDGVPEVGLGVVETAESMSIFRELLQTLSNPEYMIWDSQDAMALILVRERKVAHKIKEQLKRTTFIREHEMRVAVVVGHGAGSADGDGMNLRKQDKVLSGIRQRRYHIIIATSVAEEGIDIPECQLVVCLNPPTTVKALVQMRGRARKKDSYFVVLCSSEKEKDKLVSLQSQELNMKWAAAELAKEIGQ